jgi:hypothetical protein
MCQVCSSVDTMTKVKGDKKKKKLWVKCLTCGERVDLGKYVSTAYDTKTLNLYFN